MSKHTQGEWFAKRAGWSTIYVECRIGGGRLQEVAACGPTANGADEQEANATLIAAAPDLLVALEVAEQMMLECVYIGDITEAGGACLAKIRAAIARAKGEPV